MTAAKNIDVRLIDNTSAIGAIFIASNSEYLYPIVNKDIKMIHENNFRSILLISEIGFPLRREKMIRKLIAKNIC